MKPLICQACEQAISERIGRIREAIAHTQEAAQGDAKSSSGDKYETGLAMMHLEQEKNHTQLNEALELQRIIRQINPNGQHISIQTGSVAYTSAGIFFIAVSLGKLQVEGQTVFAISPASPMGQCLMGLKAGQQGSLQGRAIVVERVT
jgi:transcription elongation GreA/GreB family factor